ncbi:MAG: hypothetical protein QW818_03025 [Candidatus Aenigmatarchaeota archaeon]|nr:hypothetical protein [Candidatus Aenigmarchaeota archaeon]
MEKFELRIKDVKDIYHELALALIPHRNKPVCSVEFIVEGTKEKPIIGIRYPGRKVVKRELKVKRADFAEWGNLLDFVVVPYIDGKEAKEQDFTFEKILKDFEENKRDNEEFWKLIEEVYYKNVFTKEPPKLPGIESRLFLLVLKWIWIQEDLNYKLSWQDVGSPIKYILVTKSGSRTEKGAGRAKFFAALILLKHHFKFDEVIKIIPMYA